MASSSQETGQNPLAANGSYVLPAYNNVTYSLQRPRDHLGHDLDNATAHEQHLTMGQYVLQQMKSPTYLIPGASLSLNFNQDRESKGMAIWVDGKWQYSREVTRKRVHRLVLATYNDGAWQLSEAAQAFAHHNEIEDLPDVMRTLALSSLKELSQTPEYREILEPIFFKSENFSTMNSSGWTELRNSMVERASPIIDQVSTNHSTPLLRLIDKAHNGTLQKEQVLMLFKLLMSAGASLGRHQGDYFIQHTPLSFAAYLGNEEMVSLLLAEGANKDELTPADTTPLYVAAHKGHEKVVALLLAAGADKDIVRPVTKTTPLYAAARAGRHDIVHLLQNAGANVEGAYILAQKNNDEKAMQLLHPYLASSKSALPMIGSSQEEVIASAPLAPEEVQEPVVLPSQPPVTVVVAPPNALTEFESLMICPITQEVMREPVIAADGHTYELAAIEAWFSKNDTSPMTNLKLPNKELLRNHLVRQIIEKYNTLKAFEATIPQGAGQLATAYGAFSQPISSSQQRDERHMQVSGGNVLRR